MGSLAGKAFPGAINPKDPEFLDRAAVLINNLLAGKTNNTGSVTLRSGGVSTTVSDARCGPQSLVVLMATSSTGSVALDQWSVQTRTNGAFTITHISTSTANCTAAYAIIG